MEHTENTILLRGELQALPQFSHENHHKRFFRFLLGTAQEFFGKTNVPCVQCLQRLCGGALSMARGWVTGPFPP